MNNEISRVLPESIAEELGIEVGDKLIKINGSPVNDIIDYRFLMADEYVVIEIEKNSSGEIWELEIEKEYDEKLGVEFKEAILDHAKSCRNKCIFCFIDQLPKGMRETLYFKDDDSRLSFLQGNFVTLTNMSDEDIERIIRYRISPINISVHSTNPKIREMMLNNRFAGNVIERIKRLASNGIIMNCQIVLCPGVNNGEELINTVKDLFQFYPSVQNVAGVPIGVTKYREGLYKVNTYDSRTAEDEINSIKKLQEEYISKTGTPFIRLSDEFYVLAKKDVPESDFYGEFDQLEDGIGMIRVFRNNIADTIVNLKDNIQGSFNLVTGVSAFNEIKEAAHIINNKNKNNNVKISPVKIINKFFGETITVAGLLTGSDIITQLKTLQLEKYIIIPKNMLKSGTDIFLDDLAIKDLETALNRKVLVCDYTGEDLIDIINTYCEEE
ncbi:MAG: DUF512 domain-containing protein [Bacillota bacterium]|nr:DUF512 domain-containing protein [Bacillota bacterium]